MFLPNKNFNLNFLEAKRHMRKVISNRVENVTTVNCAVVGFTSWKKIVSSFPFDGGV